MKELELYKLLASEDNDYGVSLADEIRWTSSEDKLYTWVSYNWIKEFIESIKKLFGDYMFEEGGFRGDFQEDGVCFDLEIILSGYGIDLKKVFPPKDYK